MEHWIEFRTAYCVARTGTVSAAALELGVHRSTINRHIDTLEGELGAKLFIRHRRGYQLTETGIEFLQVFGRAHGLLNDFSGRIRLQCSEVSGEVIITTLLPISKIIIPALIKFRRLHPKATVSILNSERQLRLELAEAHIALRVGEKPANDDYVVQNFCILQFGLFAHESYVERHGAPSNLNDTAAHYFVGAANEYGRKPFEHWLARSVPAENIILRTADAIVTEDAILSGAGLGFIPIQRAKSLPHLRQIGPSLDEWDVPVWLVTHVDLHRADKVQSMLHCLKEIVL